MCIESDSSSSEPEQDQKKTTSMIEGRNKTSSGSSRGPLKKKVKREMDAQLQAAESAVPSKNNTSSAKSIETDSVSSSDAGKATTTEPPTAYYKVGGRIRLPDKLMEYLNKKVLPDTLWWQPDGDGFAFNTDTIQVEFLDKHFRGTKLTSFIRSLNRWGFRRIFYHSLPNNALSFHHPLFKKETPHLIHEMKMVTFGSGSSDKKKSCKKRKASLVANAAGAPEAAQVPAIATSAALPSNPVQQGVVLQALLPQAAPSPPSALVASASAPMPPPSSAPLIALVTSQPLHQQQAIQNLLSSILNSGLAAAAAAAAPVAPAPQPQVAPPRQPQASGLQQLFVQQIVSGHLQQQQQQSTLRGLQALLAQRQQQQPPQDALLSSLQALTQAQARQQSSALLSTPPAVSILPAPAPAVNSLQNVLAALRGQPQPPQPQVQAPSLAVPTPAPSLSGSTSLASTNPIASEIFRQALQQQQNSQAQQLNVQATLRLLGSTRQPGSPTNRQPPQEETKSASDFPIGNGVTNSNASSGNIAR